MGRPCHRDMHCTYPPTSSGRHVPVHQVSATRRSVVAGDSVWQKPQEGADRVQRPRGTWAPHAHRWEQVLVAESPWVRQEETGLPPCAAEIHSERGGTHSPVSETVWVRQWRRCHSPFSLLAPTEEPRDSNPHAQAGCQLPACPNGDQGSLGRRGAPGGSSSKRF